MMTLPTVAAENKARVEKLLVKRDKVHAELVAALGTDRQGALINKLNWLNEALADLGAIPFNAV